jgi:hypothetical protein
MYSSLPWLFYRLPPYWRRRKKKKEVLPGPFIMMPEYKWSGAPVVSVSEFPRK